ncbi:hypothetical protein OTEC02_01550 [Acinetobacter lactucae]|nr:hypothetical protein OTEC02_01550 [Acinetobacter lactucae]KQE95166.1 hypothetical protein APB94_04045 [Acinetobacter lactucae]RSO36973.1 hypothetical protein EA763_05735 [Acinetobacter lactucae]
MCIAYPSFNKALSSVKQTTSFCDSAYGRQLAQCFTKKIFGLISQYTLFHFYVHWFLLEKCFDLFRTLLKQFDPTTLHRIHSLERQNSLQHINKHKNKAKTMPI